MTALRIPRKPLRKIPTVIAVDRKASRPLYQQICDAYRNQIVRGDLRAGELVPSTRELARELRISRLPVLNAYSQLLAEGHFETRIGSGTFIASTIRTSPPARLSRHTSPPAAVARLVSARARTLPEFERPVWAESLGAFQVGQPELQTFPVQVWSRLLSRCAREL